MPRMALPGSLLLHLLLYVLYVRLMCTLRKAFHLFILSFLSLSPFYYPLSPFLLLLCLPFPLYLHIICTKICTLSPFPLSHLYMYLFCFVVIRSLRRPLIFIEPFPLSPIFLSYIYNIKCTYISTYITYPFLFCFRDYVAVICSYICSYICT